MIMGAGKTKIGRTIRKEQGKGGKPIVGGRGKRDMT